VVLVEDSGREPVEFSVVHRLRNDLQVGLEGAPQSGNLFPVVNWRILEAGPNTPAVVVGTSSAWPSSKGEGNAVFVTAAQLLAPGVSGSVSLSYGLDEKKWQVPASVRTHIAPNVEGTLVFDGDQFHPLVTYRLEDLSFSFILLNVKDPTISVSWTF